MRALVATLTALMLFATTPVAAAEAAVEAPRMVELVATAPTTPCSLELSCPSGHVIKVTGVELTAGVHALLAAPPEPTTC